MGSGAWHFLHEDIAAKPVPRALWNFVPEEFAEFLETGSLKHQMVYVKGHFFGQFSEISVLA